MLRPWYSTQKPFLTKILLKIPKITAFLQKIGNPGSDLNYPGFTIREFPRYFGFGFNPGSIPTRMKYKFISSFSKCSRSKMSTGAW